ncbi:hypothetical protein P0082_02510 [Candidatus Haliotispira prima]|uniref:Virion structural protein n=1 Tax=Candidatus Haliotispira prima TaxID=3034016 RepID=A0ABY8MIA3_9SPIO|nr:hypothetical protein P0082_02510 [Candidatus Haliotispira prima]
MAWVSMREGLVQFDNGTQGTRTIGAIVSRETTAPAYNSVKDLPGFYTRTTKADGIARTVYLSMTDEMTTAKFNTSVTVSVDGRAAGFVSAVDSAPEILHPNTKYYTHFYEIAGTIGTSVEKLEFTTEDFPIAFPTSRGTYSNIFDQIMTATSPSPAIEYKSSETYLVPLRMHYLHTSGGPYSTTDGILVSEWPEASKLTRPFGNIVPETRLLYDLYNITTSGPGTSVALWDGLLKSVFNRPPQTNGRPTDTPLRMNHSFGGDPFVFFDRVKMVLVTE